MFVGHFAASLALRGRARQVPVAVYISGAFLLDFLWVSFGVTRVDLTPWSDWSHSLVMAMVWATAFAAVFAKFGRDAIVAVWLVVFSHYVLDLLVQGATLSPGRRKACSSQSSSPHRRGRCSFCSARRFSSSLCGTSGRSGRSPGARSRPAPRSSRCARASSARSRPGLPLALRFAPFGSPNVQLESLA